MSRNLETQRLDRLEQEIVEIKLKIGTLYPVQWVNLTKAALSLGTTAEILRRKIRNAIVFPDKSLYKEGVHWKIDRTTSVDPTKEGQNRYKINLLEWGKV
jgi:hypothetical protein